MKKLLPSRSDIKVTADIPARFSARKSDEIFGLLGTMHAPKLADRIALAIEHYIAELPEEKQAAAWQELPYLVQFGPVLSKYGKKLPDIRWVNPGIRYGGLTEYAKDEIYRLLPTEHQLHTVDLLDEELPSIEYIETIIADQQLNFPLMKKANRGERGAGIYYLADIATLQTHWSELSAETLAREASSLQEYCDREQEYCLQFYQVGSRIEPGSLTLRDIPFVTGNGKQTVRELIEALPIASAHRANIIEKIQTTEAAKLATIPAVEERISIVRTASIDFGTKYLTQHLTAEQTKQLTMLLQKMLEHIGPQIISVGRFDLKARSLEGLLAGEAKIIELNAGGGIPTHVYDEGLTIPEKYQELYAHFDKMSTIARINKAKVTNHFLSDLLTWPAFLHICYQSIRKKGISFFDKQNAKGQQIKAIYKHILRTLSRARTLRWQQRRRSLAARFNG